MGDKEKESVFDDVNMQILYPQFEYEEKDRYDYL